MDLFVLQAFREADDQSLDFLGMALIFLLMSLSVTVLFLSFKKRLWRMWQRENRQAKGLALQRELAALEIRANTREQIAADLHDALGLYFSMIVIGLRGNVTKHAGEVMADLPRIIRLCDIYHLEVQKLLQELRSLEVLPRGLKAAVGDVLYYF